MQSRSTVLLVLLALGMFGYIVFFEWPGGRDVPQQELVRRVFPELKVDEVTALSVTRSNLTIRLERSPGGAGWHLVGPEYPAQGWLVESFLSSLAELQRNAVLEKSDLEAEQGGLAALGLEPPLAAVVVESGSERFGFSMGGRTLLGKTMYMRLAGRETVEVVGAGPLERLPAGVAAWRDPRFLFLAGLEFDRLQLRSANREYGLQRDGVTSRWRLVSPRSARADHARVEQLLQQLQAAQIGAFAAEQGVADLEPFGLAKPQAGLVFMRGTNTVLSVDFGNSPTNATELVFARRSSPEGLVLVSRELVDAVAVPYAEYLDYRLVDRPVERLEKVSIAGDESFALVRGTNGVWGLAETTPRPADPGLVGSFLEQLSKLRVVEVAKEVVIDLDLPNYGLAEPRRSLTLQWAVDGGEKDVPSLRLDFGSVQDRRVFARRSDEVPVYTLAQEDFFSLPSAAYELRDRRLWEFATNEVVGVSLMVGGATNRIIRSSGGQWSIAPGSQGMVNTFAMEEAMHRMGGLRARFWVDQGLDKLPDYGITQRDHRVAIDLRQGGELKTLQLAFGANSPSGGPFAATKLEGVVTVFECPLDVFYPYDEAIRMMIPAKGGGQ